MKKILSAMLYPIDLVVGLAWLLLLALSFIGPAVSWGLHIWAVVRWWRFLGQLPDDAWARWLAIIIPPGVAEIGILIVAGWTWGFGLCTIAAGLSGFGAGTFVTPTLMIPLHLYLVWRGYLGDR